jgi:bifunctional non-homologous end joining protein LigD
LPLSRARAAFSHADWLFEIKWDGFRSLLYSDTDGVRLVSRNANTFKSFPRLCEGLACDLKGRRCVLDGEIVSLDPSGKPQFRDLLFRRAEPLFYAFDILWDEHARTDDDEENRRFQNGEDLRYLPLIDRKLRLHAVVPKRGERLLYCDHIDAGGEGLFRLACEYDLGEIVAKLKSYPYCRSVPRGLRSGTLIIRSGLVAKNCSNASVPLMLTLNSGMHAPSRARLRKTLNKRARAGLLSFENP